MGYWTYARLDFVAAKLKGDVRLLRLVVSRSIDGHGDSESDVKLNVESSHGARASSARVTGYHAIATRLG